MGFDWRRYDRREVTAADIARSLADVDDYDRLFSECFQIRSEAGGPIPFRMRRAQRKLLELYLKRRRLRRGIYIVHLKARQYGGSTLIQALMLLDAVLHPDASYITVAHDRDASTHIMEDMAAYMLEHLCPKVPISITRHKYQPVHEIILSNGSQLMAATANNLKLGRSRTFRFLHLSEVAFWWKAMRTIEEADATFQSIMGAVPEPTEVPDVTVILESTGYGRQGAFYEYWKAAEAGESDWIPYFVPWYEIEKYEEPGSDEDEPYEEALDAVKAEIDDPPREALDLLGLDQHELNLIKRAPQIRWTQLRWRRRVLKVKFRGDIERFNQEYPATPDDAFSATGMPAFSPNALVWFESRSKQREEQRHVYDVIVTHEGGKIVWTGSGFLSVWEKPQRGEQYVIGADIAAGDSAHKFRPNVKASYSAAEVLRVTKTGQLIQVAEYMARPDPIEFGVILDTIGRWYNDALMVPERNADGLSTISELIRRAYPAMYVTEVTGRDQLRILYGVQTDAKTKKVMLNTLRYAVTHKEVDIASERLVRQMHTVHYTPDGRILMPRDADLVMALMFAVWAAKQRLVLPQEEDHEDDWEGLTWDPELGLIRR